MSSITMSTMSFDNDGEALKNPDFNGSSSMSST